SLADFGIASSGSNGLARPRSSAVFGMNCAMPCAPAGLIVLGRKLLSCHISRVRNATGRLRVRADDSIRRQADVSIDSTLPVTALSDPASAELPQDRASKTKHRRIDRSSIEMSQHAFHYARSSIMSPNRPYDKCPSEKKLNRMNRL